MAITFELGFVEELVRCGLVRKRSVRQRILKDVAGLTAGQPGFDIHQVTVKLMLIHAWKMIVHAVIADAGEGTIRVGWIHAGLHLELAGEIDRDSKIDLDLANGVAEILELAEGIGAGIHHDDVFAATQNHLVKPQVLEVTTVG